MTKKSGIIATIVATVTVVLVAVAAIELGGTGASTPAETPVEAIEIASRDDLVALTTKIDFRKYNPNTVIPADQNSGNLPENVVGDPATAKVVVVEYADYQCSACAYYNSAVAALIESYGKDVALVFRSFLISGHDNSATVAAAANAAAIQGYWKAYKDIVFEKQGDWFYSKGATLQKQLETYFKEASNKKGDLEKFRSDMASSAVAQKIAFDHGLGKSISLTGTPSFYINGKMYEALNLQEAIDAALGR